MTFQSRPLHSRAAPALALLTLAALGAPAQATENGGNSYAVGVEGILSGQMLPEGLHFLSYYQHYGASHSKDNGGADNARLAYYEAEANTVALRLSYVWPGVRLWGANVETRAALAVPTVDLSLGIARPGPLGPLDRSGSKTGIGDLQFAPLLLGWHHGDVHQTAGAEGFLPIGEFNKNAAVNIGRNYWQVAPFYALTWTPGNRWQLSTKVRYAVNSKNRATDYRSGNEFTIEYSAGFVVTPGLALGINGYMYRQTTDDKQAGLVVNGNGNRGRVDAIGPYVSFNITPKVAVMARLQVEYGARNRSEGTRLWLQTKLPF
ncbi:transporter [Variovorax sp. UMC13]|uniref:SphA family protein n=1 Tax=Variovorax sp. UMC13 TaxID=1862326 RepID=UPI001601802A|nr:transporter [Variovorax sp. UMC13]MBB1601296.1 hypothetical protein [Variovorax sp. UMC13]